MTARTVVVKPGDLLVIAGAGDQADFVDESALRRYSIPVRAVAQDLDYTTAPAGDRVRVRALQEAADYVRSLYEGVRPEHLKPGLCVAMQELDEFAQAQGRRW